VNAEHLNELMIIGPITMRSACSRTTLPGRQVWIGVLLHTYQRGGLSKYAAGRKWVMGRPQIQERNRGTQLAGLIMDKTHPTNWPSPTTHFCMGGANCERLRQQDDQFGHARSLSQRSNLPRISGADLKRKSN
jgi:GTP cyclohydrolase I